MEKVSHFETYVTRFWLLMTSFNLDVATFDSDGQDKPDWEVSSLIPVLPLWGGLSSFSSSSVPPPSQSCFSLSFLSLPPLEILQQHNSMLLSYIGESRQLQCEFVMILDRLCAPGTSYRELSRCVCVRACVCACVCAFMCTLQGILYLYMYIHSLIPRPLPDIISQP